VIWAARRARGGAGQRSTWGAVCKPDVRPHEHWAPAARNDAQAPESGARTFGSEGYSRGGWVCSLLAVWRAANMALALSGP
jgi:hypothetical protein